MRNLLWLVLIGGAAGLALGPAAHAQPRPYIGYVYPAGAQSGTTVQVRLGGQGLDDVHAAVITGGGATARVLEYRRKLNPQEIRLLNEQARELRRGGPADRPAAAPKATTAAKTGETEAMMAMSDRAAAEPGSGAATSDLVAQIEKRIREHVQTPACDSIASLVSLEVVLAADAEPGERELRLVTPRGVSNPLVFVVGQLPEFSRKPMMTATKQVLGKEEQALRRRPVDEVEERVTLPCTLNGQIASGEVNRYRFTARRGQRLVLRTQARELIPFIADAVPGWFQPVLTLHDGRGKEVAYADDYRFQPDPVLMYAVPADGEYVLAIQDSLYRGREDFVYRITVGGLPFVTSLFPLGAQVGSAVTPEMTGWNLEGATLSSPAPDASPGVSFLAACRLGYWSNPLPFARDLLPDGLEQEPNNTPATAQPVTLPVILNGRMDQPGDADVFQFTGQANATVVVEVQARGLGSPLDSVIQLTDATGAILAFNDDYEDLGAGANTHHADSYILTQLPADGTYYLRIGDTARQGGRAYGYRVRLSAPQPDFALRVVPSALSLRSKSAATLTVLALRRDGFAGPIRLTLKDPPAGLVAAPVTMAGTQSVARISIRTTAVATSEPVNLTVAGSARLGQQDVVREAVPAEDRMQAFLWRHLVPASDLPAMVFDPGFTAPGRRLARARPPTPPAPNPTVAAAASAAGTPKFTPQQVAGRLRQLKLLFEEGLLADDFYDEKVAECEAAR